MRFAGKISILAAALTLIISGICGCDRDKDKAPAPPPAAPPPVAEPAPAPPAIEPKDVVLDGMYSEPFKGLLQHLTVMANDSGLTITEFRLQEPDARTRGSKQYLGMTVEGRIIDLTRYLTGLSKESIVYRVHKIDLEDIVKDKDARRCKSDIILATYRYLTVPQENIRTEGDAAQYLENERERTKYLARAIYEVDEFSIKENFNFMNFSYKCPEGEFTGVIQNRDRVKMLPLFLADQYCFEKVEVKEVKDYGSKSRKGSAPPTLFTLNFKLSEP